eukprot:s1585_g3.t1
MCQQRARQHASTDPGACVLSLRRVPVVFYRCGSWRSQEDTPTALTKGRFGRQDDACSSALSRRRALISVAS